MGGNMTAQQADQSRQVPRALIYIDGKLTEGYVVICARNGEPHSFLVRRLGLSVECPQCGRTALSANLIAAYYERMSGRARAAGPPVATQHRFPPGGS
jgi:hypothetical protein